MIKINRKLYMILFLLFIITSSIFFINRYIISTLDDATVTYIDSNGNVYYLYLRLTKVGSTCYVYVEAPDIYWYVEGYTTKNGMLDSYSYIYVTEKNKEYTFDTIDCSDFNTVGAKLTVYYSNDEYYTNKVKVGTYELYYKKTCSDKCSKQGDIRYICKNNKIYKEVCSDFNGDGCLEWGNDQLVKNCDTGESRCYDNKVVYDYYYCNDGEILSTPKCKVDTYTIEDCDSYDGWYDAGDYYEYRDYYCEPSLAYCDYKVTETKPKGEPSIIDWIINIILGK